MLNWYLVKINAENDWLNVFVLDPGFVQTEGGNKAARGFGMEKATLTVDESVDGLFQVLNTATKESYGGKVVFLTSEILSW
jgi:norsolorinic acid ketoreductase